MSKHLVIKNNKSSDLILGTLLKVENVDVGELIFFFHISNWYSEEMELVLRQKANKNKHHPIEAE